jgi:hypothetical protein
MKKYLSFAALFAALSTAQPASAITFPKLTTIYVIAGVVNSADGPNVGIATAFQCSNVSGVLADIRFLALDASGSMLDFALLPVAHGATIHVSTHGTMVYASEIPLIAGTALNSGVVNIESTQSAVFCTAAVVDAAAPAPGGISPHIVRVNPHPGTVE